MLILRWRVRKRRRTWRETVFRLIQIRLATPSLAKIHLLVKPIHRSSIANSSSINAVSFSSARARHETLSVVRASAILAPAASALTCTAGMLAGQRPIVRITSLIVCQHTLPWLISVWLGGIPRRAGGLRCCYRVVTSHLVGVVIWGILRWIAGTPALLADVKACRGNWAEARLRHCEGELAVTGMPVEPFNTFSNLAYIAAAWVVWQTFPGLPAVVLAASFVLLGIGSSIYHGTKAMWAARIDHAGCMPSLVPSRSTAWPQQIPPCPMSCSPAPQRSPSALPSWPRGPQRPHGCF